MATESKPISCSRFYGQCFGLAGAKAWKAFSDARGCAALVAAICTAGLIAGAIAKLGWDVNRYFLIVPAGAAVFVFVFQLLKSPFLIYMGEEQTFKADLAKKQTDIDGLNAKLEAATNNELKQIAETEEKKRIKDELGNWHFRLQFLGEEIVKIPYFDYEESTIGKEKEDKITALATEIIRFLADRVGLAEAALFRDAKPENLPPQQDFQTFDNQKRMRVIHYNRLEAYKRELTKIIVSRHN
jgi:hypothetical protein